MATKTVIHVTDDLDGTEASETIRFGLDGTNYAIDLNEDHARELREALSRFTAVARREGGQQQRRNVTKLPGSVDTKAVRTWAIEHGIKVNTRGRIQADVVERYLAENK